MRMNHHPKDETLAAYAAGALDEAQSIVMATHLAMCLVCRRAVADFEAVGGACVGAIEPEAMSAGSLARFWERAGPQQRGLPAALAEVGGDVRIPEALRAHIAGKFEAVEWRPVFKGFSQAVLEAKGYRAGALRLPLRRVRSRPLEVGGTM